MNNTKYINKGTEEYKKLVTVETAVETSIAIREIRKAETAMGDAYNLIKMLMDDPGEKRELAAAFAKAAIGMGKLKMALSKIQKSATSKALGYEEDVEVIVHDRYL